MKIKFLKLFCVLRFLILDIFMVSYEYGEFHKENRSSGRGGSSK